MLYYKDYLGDYLVLYKDRWFLIGNSLGETRIYNMEDKTLFMQEHVEVSRLEIVFLYGVSEQQIVYACDKIIDRGWQIAVIGLDDK